MPAEPIIRCANNQRLMKRIYSSGRAGIKVIVLDIQTIYCSCYKNIEIRT